MLPESGLIPSLSALFWMRLISGYNKMPNEVPCEHSVTPGLLFHILGDVLEWSPLAQIGSHAQTSNSHVVQGSAMP